MADPHSLMHPLRSDSLKPRPSTQAAWPPDRPAAAPEPQPQPEPVVVTPVEDPQPLPFLSFAPETASVPPAPPQPEPLPAAEEQGEEPFDLDAVIAAILAEDDDEDDELSAAQDALPSSEMPEPACVPLYVTDAPKPKRRGWLWLFIAALLAAAAGAAWYFKPFF